MNKENTTRSAEYPVDRVFIDRWSPRAMSGEEISNEELMTLMEAARWSPSSMNNQPWRMLYAHRRSPSWHLFYDLLVEANKVWCVNAAALVLFVSKTTHENGSACRTHSYDAGAAWMSLALQGSMRNYVIHGMQGFNYEQARTSLNIPEGFEIEAMAAIGRPGNPESLPEQLQQREVPSGRRPLEQIVCEGEWKL